MRRVILLPIVLYILTACTPAEPQILQAEVERIIGTLASDEMRGRRTFSPEIDLAADFISGEFERIGLQKWDGLDSYKQEFYVFNFTVDSLVVKTDGKSLGMTFATTTSENISWTQESNVASVFVGEKDTLQRTYGRYRRAGENAILWIHPAHQQLYTRYASFLATGSRTMTRAGGSTIVFAISESKPELFSVEFTASVTELPLANVVGYIEGNRKDEYVLFSAHYDHIGIQRPVEGDSIANGANDDASGSTAVIMLADYFKAKSKPERSLLFVTFTAEEIGGYGSRYFSQQLDPDKIVAMFNIEMIGKPATDGPNSAWITGFDKSDFGQILQKSVEGTEYKFYPDPYPTENLFYRSDNATLARLGVPAHSISTTPIDVDPDYHQVSDEVKTLNLEHLAKTIKAISAGAATIISGEATPTRVNPANVN